MKKQTSKKLCCLCHTEKRLACNIIGTQQLLDFDLRIFPGILELCLIFFLLSFLNNTMTRDGEYASMPHCFRTFGCIIMQLTVGTRVKYPLLMCAGTATLWKAQELICKLFPICSPTKEAALYCEEAVLSDG
jgi:hypothetical protein